MVHETCGEKCSNGAPKKIVLIIYLYHTMWTLSYGLISPLLNWRSTNYANNKLVKKSFNSQSRS